MHNPVNAAPLDQALHYLRMSGTFYCRAEYSSPWAVTLPPTGGEARFHVITDGHAYLQGKGLERRLLNTGDMVLLPHGAGHELADDPASAMVPPSQIVAEAVSDRYHQSCYGDGKDTRLVCVKALFEDPTAQRLISLLPKVIHVPASDTAELESINRTVRFIAEEARALRPGGETIITRLADVLVVQVIRWWIENEPGARIGWLGALRDRQVGRALMLIHRKPEHPWTIANLAEDAAMSRSLLAARFKEMVGEPVMQYLARWRMNLALHELQQRERVDIGRLAERVGYQSESAFNRAFKKHVGIPPGAVKRLVPAEEA